MTVLLFAFTSVVFTACITGLAPAFRSARADGARLTSLDGRGVTLGKLHSRLVGVLVSAEVALTVILVVGAGLLVRSAFQASQVETGFNPDHLLTMTISLPANKFDWDHNAVFAREVIEAVQSLSSISDAAAMHGVPMRAGAYLSNGQGTIEGWVPTITRDRSTAEQGSARAHHARKHMPTGPCGRAVPPSFEAAVAAVPAPTRRHCIWMMRRFAKSPRCCCPSTSQPCLDRASRAFGFQVWVI